MQLHIYLIDDEETDFLRLQELSYVILLSILSCVDFEGNRNSVRDRALTEEHARDSFENLLFSICRFRELTGSYPHNITVCPLGFVEFEVCDIFTVALISSFLLWHSGCGL